jgi:hypothetical protein
MASVMQPSVMQRSEELAAAAQFTTARGALLRWRPFSFSDDTFVDDDARLLKLNQRVGAMSEQHEQYLATIASLVFVGRVMFLASVGVLLILL